MIIISKATIDMAITMEYIDSVCFCKQIQYDSETFGYLINEGSSYVAIDTDCNKIVGYVVTTVINIDECPLELNSVIDIINIETITELSSIAILPEYRNKKISHMLLEAIDKHLPMYLHVKNTNKIAQKLYEKNNWIYCANITDYYGKGEDALLMCKNVNKSIIL